MRRGKITVTTAEALSRVFNIPVKRPVLEFLPGRPIRPYRCIFDQRSAFSTSIHRQAATFRTFEPRVVDPSKYGPARTEAKSLRDEEIRVRWVCLRLPSGRLSEPQLLQDVLDGRERDEKGKLTQFVQLVAPASVDKDRKYPIVLVCNRKEAKDKEIAIKKKAKDTKHIEKFLELGWSIGERDLEHRIGRLKEFLEKGARVEVVFGSRRLRGWSRKRDVPLEEAKGLLEKIRAAAMEVPGTKETGQMQGKILEQATVSFQGPSKKEKEQKSRGSIEETDPDAK